MSYQKAYQEPYTKYPNRYNDIIKPLLTSAQRDVCDVVIRMTYGWHQTSAEISNSVFTKKANKSKQGIIKAKKQLEEMGILVVLGEGGGSKTNEYTLDLWYDNPDRSIKASMLRQEEQLLEMENLSPQEHQEDIPELIVAPVAAIAEEPQLTEKPQQIIMEENPDCGIPELQIVEPENHTPEEPDWDPEISGTVEAENPVIIKDSEPPTSKLSLPPYKEDLSSSILSNKEKQTVNATAKAEVTKANPEKKKAAATVRFQFLSLFPGARADDDWKFFGWAAKEYGVEACLSKLDYMREHRKQCSITNPKGFFRTALVRDFQPPAFLAAKLRADERAKREIERCGKESEKWRQITTNFNYESAAASLQKLMDSLN